MARGGARPNAGRKKGAATKRTREIADKAAAEGVTPLEFMLSVMRDESADPSARADMAKAAAPYVHPKLAAVEHSGPDGGAIEHDHRITKIVREIIRAPDKDA